MGRNNNSPETGSPKTLQAPGCSGKYTGSIGADCGAGGAGSGCSGSGAGSEGSEGCGGAGSVGSGAGSRIFKAACQSKSFSSSSVSSAACAISAKVNLPVAFSFFKSGVFAFVHFWLQNVLGPIIED